MTNLAQSAFRRRSEATQRYDGGDAESFSFNGNSYSGIPTTLGNGERIEADFRGLVNGAYKRNGVIWACELARLAVFSEARFQWRQMRNGRPGELFGTADLELVERPWQNATTGDLLTRMLQDVDFGGNAYLTVRNGAVRRMRPDWVTIVMGSENDPRVSPEDLDAELLGYVYWPGGFGSQSDPTVLLAGEVAHFAPIPDPLAHYRGMSWLTPVVRELQADNAVTSHKQAFFDRGASLQTVVSFDKDMKPEALQRFIAQFNSQHQGTANAYKTLFLGGGADVTVVGANLQQLDFKVVQGAGETRIAAAAGVPPVIVGLSEGLQSATYSNYGQARRRFADGTLRPLWRNAAGSLQTLLVPPTGAELWYDDRDIAFLREDRGDVATIQERQALTIRQLTDAGFVPETAVAAVLAEDYSLLKHSGLFSVQLQKPQSGQPEQPAPPASAPPALPAPAGNGKVG